MVILPESEIVITCEHFGFIEFVNPSENEVCAGGV